MQTVCFAMGESELERNFIDQLGAPLLVSETIGIGIGIVAEIFFFRNRNFFFSNFFNFFHVFLLPGEYEFSKT